MKHKYYYYEEYIYRNLSEKVYSNYYSTEDNIQHVFDEEFHHSFEHFGEEAFLLEYNSRPLFGSKKREIRLDSNDVFYSKLEELTKEEYCNELMLRELKK